MRDHSDGSGAAIEALAHPRRRETLTVLADLEAPVPLSELATAVDEVDPEGVVVGEPATDGGTTPGGDAPGARPDSSDDRKRIELDLYHRHLPKLEAAGLVRFDPAAKVVEDWRSAPLLDRI